MQQLINKQFLLQFKVFGNKLCKYLLRTCFLAYIGIATCKTCSYLRLKLKEGPKFERNFKLVSD